MRQRTSERTQMQRRGFGPGEDHNFQVEDFFGNWVTGRQRRGFGPGEDHNLRNGADRPQWLAGSAGASALARITTRTRPGCRRGSRRQRRGFGPGEDHNTLHGDGTVTQQRRGFGPGEDHNLSPAAFPFPNGPGSAGASALARITTSTGRVPRGPDSPQRRGFGPGEDHNVPHPRRRGEDSGSAGASALASITTTSARRRHAAARMLAAASVLLAG